MTTKDHDELVALAGRYRSGDAAAGGELVAEFVPLVRHILRRDRPHLPAADREDLEAEAAVVLLEYFTHGGDPAAAKVASVLRGRLRAVRDRPVRLTEGEELVVRLTAGVRSEMEVHGRPLSGLRAEVEERCRRWALDLVGGDEEAAARKLVQRGIARALRDFDGLLSVAEVVRLDAPLPGGGSVADLVADDADDTSGDGGLAGLLLDGLDDAERRAVAMACGLDGEVVPRQEAETACGLPARSVHKLLGRLAWRARSPHTSWALFSPSLDAQVETVPVSVVDELAALAAGRGR